MWNYITPRPLRLLRSEKALADRAAGSLKSAANRIFLLERRKIFQVAGPTSLFKCKEARLLAMSRREGGYYMLETSVASQASSAVNTVRRISSFPCERHSGAAPMKQG